MFVIIVLGVALAVLTACILFVLAFIDVAAQGPTGSECTGTSTPSRPETTLPAADCQPPTSRDVANVVASGYVAPRPRPASKTNTVAITTQMLFSRDARHLRVLVVLIAIGGVGAFFIRSLMIPEAFGKRGPYRAAALEQVASRPSMLQSDAACLKCHSDVQEERSESPHAAVGCMHCHGNGHEHMAAATKAESTSGFEIPPAQEWDGDFRTKLDLFITQDRATCLSCHTRVVGMPDTFRSINVAEHLEEQGAEEVNGKNVCFECHAGHSPGI